MPKELEQYSPHGAFAGLWFSRENGARDRDRTCDPFHVKEVLFRYANAILLVAFAAVAAPPAHWKSDSL
jgi:hypothetical protein